MNQDKVALKNFTEEELKEFMKTIGEKLLEEVKFTLGYTRVLRLLMI